MPQLTVDELLTTTRAVRRRLDLTRPVDPALLRECLELATQAPTGGNNQDWHFVVVTDPGTRTQLAELYRAGAAEYGARTKGRNRLRRTLSDDERAVRRKVLSSSGHLFEHLHEVPALVIPCIDGRLEGTSLAELATAFGGILPAVWSFMLACRSRGLGTSWTTVHLERERDVAELLGIPYEEVTQVALIPVAHTVGDDFKPGTRLPVDDVLHWERW
jgi:nitroreductase